ncbi:uncharacterized protein LOC141600295 isoform X2 [Silene latifolia]|uniref:uncharacterized protein LOC141600295 isoform X2 n=1 Tax=Silene latifolia TaxID=37657 RepID=UPI003D779369
MIEQFINFVIRPPRASYDPDKYLWEKEFTLAGKAYKREDLELRNKRGQTLKCSHYVPSIYPTDSAFPCVIYCHGNSGCRADANEAAVVLLPANITVFTLDFSGSGLSDGSYVSLGWHEKNDLGAVVSYLRNTKHVSRIGLWGRSMGAVTCLLYGSEDPSITGMALDSAFSDLFNLMMELVDVYKIRLPKFTVKMGVQYMRRVIQKRANFDIKDLNCTQVASKTFVPALFAHANGDRFIQPHHSDIIFKLFAGEKNIIKFDGDHNSPRPQFYYDSVSIFFYNTLKPPQVSSVWSNKIGVSDMGEGLLYEIISNLRVASIDAASSSSALRDVSNTKYGEEFISEIPPALGDKVEETVEECCSTSSARESWGRCSSLEGSESAENTTETSGQQITPAQVTEITPLPTENSAVNRADMCTKKGISTGLKKPQHEKLERLGAFGRRLRLSILNQVKNRK